MEVAISNCLTLEPGNQLTPIESEKTMKYESNRIHDRDKKNLILIDDDKAFSLILKEFANTMSLNLDCYGSLSELASIGQLAQYDGAIIDYELDDFNGVEIAQYFDSFFKTKKPVVLISGKDRSGQQKSWPEVIEAFVHKDSGPQAILDRIAACLNFKHSFISASQGVCSEIQ